MNIVRNFKELPRNTKVNLMLLYPWGIPFNLIASYGSLYMLNMGMTATQIGKINAIAFVLKAFLSLFSGFAVNKLGRNIAMGLGDIIGTGIALLILFFANSYEMFLLAYLVWALSSMTGIACICYYVEDVPIEKRLFAHNLHYTIIAVCTLSAPISSLLINKHSFLPAMKGMYLFAAIVISICGFLKLTILKNTTVGCEIKKQKSSELNTFSRILPVFKYIVSSPKILVLFGLQMLFNFALSINAQYYYPFLQEQLHFSEVTVSYFTVITTFINFGGYLFLVPRIKNAESCLLWSILLYAGGAAILLFASLASALAFICSVFWAIAGTLMAPVLATITSNTLNNELRTDVMGYMSAFSMLCLSPISTLTGWLFDVSPISVMGIIFLLYVSGSLLYTRYIRQERAKQSLRSECPSGTKDKINII